MLAKWILAVLFSIFCLSAFAEETRVGDVVATSPAAAGTQGQTGFGYSSQEFEDSSNTNPYLGDLVAPVSGNYFMDGPKDEGNSYNVFTGPEVSETSDDMLTETVSSFGVKGDPDALRWSIDSQFNYDSNVFSSESERLSNDYWKSTPTAE